MIRFRAPHALSECEVYYCEQLIGRLVTTDEAGCAFQYSSDYLGNGQSISPFFLPLDIDIFRAPLTPFQGNFGVFDDSLPDGWGSFVLDRYLKNEGIDPYSLNIPQRLSLVGSAARGALEYRPDLSMRTDSEVEDFEGIARQVQDLYRSARFDPDELESIYRYSGSVGGARPKVFVTMSEQEWLVKFPASIDPQDVGKQEYDYSLLAAQCGIFMSDTQLFGEGHFGTKRFDRSPEGKIHTVSAAGLLHADYRIPSLDYRTLLVACQRLTRDIREVKKLFRLMTFNVCIGNRDDHAKNFSFQLHGENWKLSPAYDLLPSNGFNGQHTTTINDSGDPRREDLLSCGSRAGLDSDEMNNVIDEVLHICQSEKMNRSDLNL